MSATSETMTKGEFASLCQVDKSRVSHWIRDKKIGPDALIGAGRNARIIVDTARAQLRTRLDPAQRLGNGLGTKLSGPTPDAATREAAPEAPPVSNRQAGEDCAGDEAETSSDDGLDIALKRAKLMALQSAQRKADEEEMARQGRFVEASAARRQMGVVAAQVVREFEGVLPEMATDLAARFGIDGREVLQLLKESFCRVRQQAAERASTAASRLPPLTPDTADAIAEASP